MPRPATTPLGEAVYARLGPVAVQDETLGWPLLTLVQGLAEMARQVEDLVRPAAPAGQGPRRVARAGQSPGAPRRLRPPHMGPAARRRPLARLEPAVPRPVRRRARHARRDTCAGPRADQGRGRLPARHPGG